LNIISNLFVFLLCVEQMHQPSSFGPLPDLKDIKSMPPAPPPPSPHIKSKLHQPLDGFAEITFSDDSRVQVVDLSLDHKPGRLDERIRIQRAGSKVIATSHYQSMMCGLSEATIDGPLRVNPAGLSLSRSVGDATAKKALPGLDAGPVIHNPELTITQIDSDCLFMIIGTDGLVCIDSLLSCFVVAVFILIRFFAAVGCHD
jgi:hypothetical protein